ncbi:ABC transporter ATP-binding protein [Mollicutes bacterium LVI A0039]|nr:ABC transporter ATP-binding protein [Mollicutes bacterium LVI A0039]
MIKIENLTINYEDQCVLDNVSTTFPKGQITTIIGPNGCGKSTLIKAIAGLFDNGKSQIKIDGKPRSEYQRKEFSRKVSFLMQFSAAPIGMTVRELVTFGRQPYKQKFKNFTTEDYKVINWAMRKTSTDKFEDKLVSQLSGGEKQRVFLALALAQKTEVIILDEPTNHLDIKYQHELLQLIQELNLEEKITIICVLHDVNQAYRYSDKVVVMKSGKIIASGTPEQCLTKDIMHQVYDVNCMIEKIGNHHNVCVI